MNFQLRNLLILAFSFFLLISCGENISEDLSKIADLESKYEANPSKETSAAFVAGVTLYASQNAKSAKTESLLEQAKTITAEQGQSVVHAGILNELLKQFPQSNNTPTRLQELTSMMDNIGKKKASKTLKYFITKGHPNHAKAKEYTEQVADMPADPQIYLKQMAEKIFNDPDIGGLNRNASFEYVDACEAYVLVNPSDPSASKTLFNAAEIAKTVGTFKKAIGLYDWIINNYPKDEKAPTAQFLKAFILEDNMKNIDAARENYEKFIQNYPEHHFADDAKFSLDNLGKTNEEIQAELEALQLKNQEAGK